MPPLLAPLIGYRFWFREVSWQLNSNSMIILNLIAREVVWLEEVTLLRGRGLE